MGQLAQRLMAQAAEVLTTRNVEAVMRLEKDNDRMDEQHRIIFQHLMDDRWRHGVETGVDVTLTGPHYERFADHAVPVARRVVFLVTGEHANELADPPMTA
jgi:phosphate transport system protein